MGYPMRLVTDRALAAIVVWQEARGEPQEAKTAVAEVLRNRLARRWGGAASLPEICFARFQFSAMNDETPWRGISFSIDDTDPVVQHCLDAVDLAFVDQSSLTHGAVLFLNVDLTRQLRGGTLPGWYDARRVTATYGQLTFLTA